MKNRDCIGQEWGVEEGNVFIIFKGEVSKVPNTDELICLRDLSNIIVIIKSFRIRICDHLLPDVDTDCSALLSWPYRPL